MEKFRHLLTELSARGMSVFSFLDDNFSIISMYVHLYCGDLVWDC